MIDEDRLKTQRRNFGHYFRCYMMKEEELIFVKHFQSLEDFYHDCLNIKL